MSFEVVNFEKFVEEATEALSNITIQGFVSWDISLPNHLLFGLDGSCPRLQIPKDKVKKIELGATLPCTGKIGRMWEAKVWIELAKGEDANANLYCNLLNEYLRNTPKCSGAGCGCSTSSSENNGGISNGKSTIWGYSATADMNLPGFIRDTLTITGVITADSFPDGIAAAKADAIRRLSNCGSIITGPTVGLGSPFIGVSCKNSAGKKCNC